jgi:hypothetical protein
MPVNAYTSVSDALHALENQGFTEEFRVVDDIVEAMDSGRRFAPEQLTIVQHHRFEGLTDLEDEAVVYAVEADGTRGVIVDAYGTYASPDLAAVLQRASFKEQR